MLFSIKKLILPAIGALALLQCTVARPFPPVVDDSIIERRETDVNRGLVREFVQDSRLERSRLGRRGWSPNRTRDTNANPETVPESQIKPPSSPTFTLSKNARKELDEMGLHGKQRKNEIKWHKKQMKQYLVSNPALKKKASTGVIEHVATKGAKDPKEKKHFTASFRDKNGHDVLTKVNGEKIHDIHETKRVRLLKEDNPDSTTHSKKKAKGNPNAKDRPPKALPNTAKLTLSEDARKELDGMGLHGKARKQLIKWHKKQVKKEMNTNPLLKGQAITGVIEHVAHKGGHDPKEKNHITASFLTKLRKPIPNTYNGGANHHLYVNEKGLPQQAKAGSNKNNAAIKGQSTSHQTSVSRTRSRGKSRNKGKGKQNPGREFSKNANKGFQEKRHN